MVYQILNDAGEVINTIIADEAFVEKKYPGHYVLVGPDPVPFLLPVITKLAMIDRFTEAEYESILTAAKTDVQIQGWLDRFNASNQINLEDSRTISGINLFVSKELLTQERGNEILTAPVQDFERP
jgi:hypothetical protein